MSVGTETKTADGRDALLRVIGGGISFTPSSYDADLTMDGTAQAVALATGTLKLKIVNHGATTESIRLVFGTSESDAQTNLTMTTDGVPEHATTGDLFPAASDQGDGIYVYGVPANATHYAIANAVDGDTQAVSISQGI